MSKFLSFDSTEVLDLWESTHYYEMESPKEIYEPGCLGIPPNPNPGFRSTLCLLTLHPDRLEALPAPTWRAYKVTETGQAVAVVGYCLPVPASTEEIQRSNKTGVGRRSDYNLSLQVEHNLALAAGGSSDLPEIPNPHNLDSDWIFLWSGEMYLLDDLRRDLKARELWTTGTHPAFLKAGGESSTPEQQMARAERRRQGNEVVATRAAQRAQEALRLLEDGLSRPEVAQRLGMSEVSLSKYLSRARQYAPTPASETDPLPSPFPDRSEAEFNAEAERILSLLA